MKVLVDSDALFALGIKSDSNHQKAKKNLQNLVDQHAELFILNLVVQETATILSYKINHKTSIQFLDHLPALQSHIIKLNNEIEAKAWVISKKQTKKGVSFINCANIAIYKLFKLDKIFSFNTFYQKMKLPQVK